VQFSFSCDRQKPAPHATHVSYWKSGTPKTVGIGASNISADGKFVSHGKWTCVCLLLQDLVQSCVTDIYTYVGCVYYCSTLCLLCVYYCKYKYSELLGDDCFDRSGCWVSFGPVRPDRSVVFRKETHNQPKQIFFEISDYWGRLLRRRWQLTPRV
jgi:hypothetical protein